MSPSKHQQAADRLKEFARVAPEEQSRSPLPSRARQSRAAASSDPPDTEDMAPEGAEEPTLKQVSEQVLAAIAACSASLTGKIDEVKVDVGLLRQDLQSLRERVQHSEERISQLDDRTSSMPRAITDLNAKSDQWRLKTDDLENRLRRNNIRIIGLPERSEGRNPDDFVEKWIRELFPGESFSPAFAVERAHRVPARPPPPGAPPRPFLARFLNCRDRDKILQLARQKQSIRYENSAISIFPDFSMDLQKQRASFMEVKRSLRERNISYSMLYPARLRVADGDKAIFFTSPGDADNWLRLQRRSPRRD